MNILNGYAGLGGNRLLWNNCKVTAIDNNIEILDQYHLNFPDDITIPVNAQEYLETNYNKFDFIWMSPPCKTLSKLNTWTRHKIIRMPDYQLYEVIDFFRNHVDIPWVVENVKSAKHLVKYDFSVGRHCFWSNCIIPSKEFKSLKNFSKAKRSELVDYLGLDYQGNIYLNGNHDPCQVLRNCVHPKIGEYIMEHLLN